MKLLLDESVPIQLKKLLVGHDVWAVRDMGWSGKSNGELLALARDQFQVFITLDRNLEHQQKITAGDIPIIVLIARRSRMDFLEPLVPQVLEVLQHSKRGQIVRIGAL